MDWFPAVMAFVGVLIGAGIQEFRVWREKKDKYKDMVFRKRVDAHQGAYYWCMRLFDHAQPELFSERGLEAGLKETDEAMEWLYKNALYLDEHSRVEVRRFLIHVHEIAFRYMHDEEKRRYMTYGDGEEESEKLREKARKALASIQAGIGAKYLPEQGDME